VATELHTHITAITLWRTEHGATIFKAVCTCGKWEEQRTDSSIILDKCVAHELSNLAKDINLWKERNEKNGND